MSYVKPLETPYYELEEQEAQENKYWMNSRRYSLQRRRT